MEKIDYSVNKTSLYEQVADSLEGAIIQSDLTAEKLPSEQELSKRFNVSRTVVREALKVLKERGLIKSRNGEGSYISKPKTDTISSAINRIIRMENISNDDLHSTRLILETAAIRLAAIHATQADMTHLEDILMQMADESIPPEERIRYDADFHVSIARAGKNELAGMFVEVMTILLNDYMIKGISGHTGMKKTLAEHNKILEELKKGKPDDAEAALREHLAASRKNVSKYEQKKRAQKEGTKRIMEK